MEVQNPPSKFTLVAGSAGMEEEGSSLIGLGLGLGPGLENGKPRFTFLQLQELEQQSLIFKYMVTGVPVPFHLVFPIWKSVVSSFDGINGGIYQNLPSCKSQKSKTHLGLGGSVSFFDKLFLLSQLKKKKKLFLIWVLLGFTVLGCDSFCFDYRNSMEPEPGRCRRTDGKKWRCSKDVVPDQKYCERHMHRGRNRSRKHVEASHLTTTTTTATKKIKDSTGKSISSTNLSLSDPESLQLVTNNNNNNNGITNSTGNSNVSSSLGFSPKSVLQSNICKTESPV